MGSNRLSVFYRERNLHGRTIRAVTITPEDLNGTHTLGNIWQLLEEKLNFTTSLTVYSGRTWGRQKNGNWTGLIGVLQRGEADVGLSTALVTLERSQAVDFSLPLLYSSFCVYIREPGSLEMEWSNFVQPLSSSLWLAVALCVLASAAYVWLLGHVAGACLPAAYEQHSLTNAFYLMFGVFCQQGHSLNGLHPACRMVYLFAYLTAVVVYTAYCAANISFVAVDRTQLPFTDLAGLLADGRYRLTTLSGSDVPTLFKTSAEPVLRTIYKKLIKPNEASLPKTQEDGLQETCMKHTAFMMPCQSAKALLSKIHCSTLALPSRYFRVVGAMVFPKNSTHRRIINQ
ncbi:glutamate receptor-like [Schistocerca cancellata]|uniref:glutamate receptor-like n=1 Tax=Schistocerca cancellata TaxID=274614 RepID=UPI0021198BCD|nr:glutamate receptor-like [Schistocerca cancellata]